MSAEFAGLRSAAEYDAAVVVRHDDGRCEMSTTPDRIAISLALLRSPKSDYMTVRGDGDLVVLCGVTYRATDEVTLHGDPIYALVTERPESLNGPQDATTAPLTAQQDSGGSECHRDGESGTGART